MTLKSEKDFRGQEGKLRVFLTHLSAASFILFFLLSFAFAQKNESPLISEVEVWVDDLPASDELRGLISAKEGDAYSLKTITENIKQAWKAGLFSDVQVIKIGEDPVRLKFMLTRRLHVRRIHIRGLKSLSGRKLKENLYSFRSDSAFSEEKLLRAQEELKRALKQEGYFQPDIKKEVRRRPDVPEVDVTFTISAGEMYVVRNIDIVDSGVIPAEEIRKKMKSREGNVYIPSRLEGDIARLKDLYFSRGYRRAEVNLVEEKFDPATRFVDLGLKITPNERIEIVIEGAEIPVSLVEPIWEERVFEEWGVTEGESRILTYLRGKGFIFASVTSSVEKTESEIRVIHAVNSGQKYKIREIRFEGVHYFTPDEIKKELGVVERILLFRLLDGKRIFELPGDIRSLYRSRGFADVQVDLYFVTEDKDLTAVFYVHEGKQQIIKEIAIKGAVLFEQETLRSQISLVEGGPYFPPDVQKEVQKLEVFYQNEGVRGTRIEAQAEALEDNLFRVVLNIQEGLRKRIGNLIISGNSVTQMRTILRELEFQEGDYASYGSIVASKRNLENLGIFSEVKIEEIPIAGETESLVITVREGERNYVGLGVGIESRNEPWKSALFDVSLRPRGTAEFMRSNVFGRAAHLSFVSQFSLAEKRAVISWEQPYFLFDFPLETYMNAWIEEEDRQSFGLEREGLSLSWIKSISPHMTLLATLRYARTTLTYLKITPSQIDRQFYPYSTTSVFSSFVREKRNDPFNPETGFFSSLAFEWAFPLFETESDFLKAVLKHQHFFKLIPRVNVSSTSRLGLGMGRMPIHERFFAGGSNSFRGEEFDELGPRDPSSARPIGGKAVFLLNIELTFPIVSSLTNLAGAVFYDMGNVFYNRSDFDLKDLEHALGLGLRYRTPLGPVRLELGWNLSDPGRKGRPLAFITIGHVF
ncbi:MAG: POTRA domain-containing protein [Clostridiales bacterium]|nr:POTRA domain-containing protein [Clostridiales bacterium]